MGHFMQLFTWLHIMICYCCKWCVFILISYSFCDFTTALHFDTLQEQEISKQKLFFFRKMVIFHRIFPSIIVQIATSKKYSNSHKFYQKLWFNLIHEGSIIMSIWISHILLICMCIPLFLIQFLARVLIYLTRKYVVENKV